MWTVVVWLTLKTCSVFTGAKCLVCGACGKSGCHCPRSPYICSVRVVVLDSCSWREDQAGVPFHRPQCSLPSSKGTGARASADLTRGRAACTATGREPSPPRALTPSLADPAAPATPETGCVQTRKRGHCGCTVKGVFPAARCSARCLPVVVTQERPGSHGRCREGCPMDEGMYTC